MNIDSDLMDGKNLRYLDSNEERFILESWTLGLNVDNNEEDAFLLGRQYERNQQKDDGK